MSTHFGTSAKLHRRMGVGVPLKQLLEQVRSRGLCSSRGSGAGGTGAPPCRETLRSEQRPPVLLALEKFAARSNGSTQPAKAPVLQERTDAIPPGAACCQALPPNPRISMFSTDESRGCEERHIEHP